MARVRNGRLGTLARIAREIRCDVAAARERDPAARGVSSLEILLNWPGVHALLAHRVSHALHAARVPLLPRAMALWTRAITNIEIHPAASVGQALFIDHGTGVVIGETAEIVDNPGHVVRVDGRKPEGPDADWIHLPDPVADAIRALSSRLDALERAVAELDGREGGSG